MPTLYDKQGRPVEVPQEKMAEALRSGNYGFAGELVFRDESGRAIGTSDPTGVLQALDRGYAIETPEQTQQREREAKYGGTGGEIAATALGASRALSFGLSDQVLVNTGLMKPEDVKGYKETNPAASMTGEVGGVVGALLLPGGQAGAAGQLGRLGGGVRAVSKMGQAAERATLRLLQSQKTAGVVRQALAKGAALGAAGAAEGAVYGAGHFLSEEAIGNTEATAENLIAHMGMGSLIGGAAGAGLGSAGSLLGSALGTGARYAKRSGKGIVRMWERATGQKAVEGLEEAVEGAIAKPGLYAETAGAAIGKEPEAIAGLLASKEARQIATSGEGVLDDFAVKLSKTSDELSDVADDVIAHGQGALKKDFIRAVTKEADHVKAVNKTTRILTDAEKQFDNMLENVRTLNEFGGANIIKDLRKTARTALKSLEKVDDATELAGISHGILDDFKRAVGKAYKEVEKSYQKNWKTHYKASMQEFNKTYQSVRNVLENETVFGKTAAELHRRVNPKWEKFLFHQDFRPRYQLRRQIGKQDWNKVEAGKARVYASDPGEYRKFVGELGDLKSVQTKEIHLAQLEAKRDLVETISKEYNLGERGAEMAKRARDLIDDYKATLARAEKTVGLQNQLNDIVQKSSKLGSMLPTMGGLGGYIIGGPVGAMAGLMLSAASNPGHLIHIRAALERLSMGVDLQIGKSIARYLRGATGKIAGKAKRLTAPVSLKVLGDENWGDRRTKDKDRFQAFERRSRELSALVSNPEKLVDRLVRNTGTISDAAPKLAVAIQQNAVRTAENILARMPKRSGRGELAERPWRPSRAELAKFERYVAGAMKPQTMLEDLEAGRLSRDTVEAVQENYPQLYERVVTMIAERIPELREELPYRERVQLSTLFGLPVESTMAPDFLAVMQQIPSGAPLPEQGGGAPKRARKGDFKKMHVDSMHASESDKQFLDLEA